jgi:hypothetical protein
MQYEHGSSLAVKVNLRPLGHKLAAYPAKTVHRPFLTSPVDFPQLHGILAFPANAHSFVSPPNGVAMQQAESLLNAFCPGQVKRAIGFRPLGVRRQGRRGWAALRRKPLDGIYYCPVLRCHRTGHEQ